MELILLIIAFYVGAYLLRCVLDVFDKRKVAIRTKQFDKAAEDVLGDFDFQKEKESILRMFSETTYSIVPEEHRCPKCNGFLTQRSGVYGKFFGCSRYPGCRYTRRQL